MEAPITSISGIHFPYKKKNMRRIPSFSIDEIRRFWPLIASKVALLDFRTHKQHQKKIRLSAKNTLPIVVPTNQIRSPNEKGMSGNWK